MDQTDAFTALVHSEIRASLMRREKYAYMDGVDIVIRRCDRGNQGCYRTAF